MNDFEAILIVVFSMAIINLVLDCVWTRTFFPLVRDFRKATLDKLFGVKPR